MADSDTSDIPQRFQRGASAAQRLRDASFPLAVRGYDRRAVDDFLEELQVLVADLESKQTREGVVQKALSEIGEETAGILQRAHETADEIAARSRAKADGRLQRAEREAEIVRREADDYARQVVDDTRLLWEDRQRLIEDIRQLADEVLATADDAMERVKMPEPLSRHGSTSSETPLSGPIGLTPSEADGPGGEVEAYRLQPVEEEPTTGEGELYPLSAVEDDTGGAVEVYPYDEEPTTGDSEAYPLDDDTTSGEVEPYPLDSLDEDTGEGEAEQDRDHTVEFEALPGGEEPSEPDSEQRD